MLPLFQVDPPGSRPERTLAPAARASTTDEDPPIGPIGPPIPAGPGKRLGRILKIRPEVSEANPDWLTPPDLLHQIQKHYGKIDLDPCPYPKPEWSGLRIRWKGFTFVNPPYGRGMEKWFEKALFSITNKHCRLVVFLVHARTDTKWWAEYVMGGAQEIWFVERKVSFVRAADGHSDRSPFPSVIIAFYRDPQSNYPAPIGAWPQK